MCASSTLFVLTSALSYCVYRQLHSARPALPDVPAVYFVSPTLANVKRIAYDLEKQLYESFHLNFVEPLPRALLEELAASVARDGTSEMVQQVCAINQLFRVHSMNRYVGPRPISVVHSAFAFAILTTSPQTLQTRPLLPIQPSHQCWKPNPPILS